MVSNSKGDLQEFCQARALPLPVYYGLKRFGSEHSPRFCIRVKVADQIFRSDKDCLTVKKAEQSAARKALEALCPSSSPSTTSSESLNIAETLSKWMQFTSNSKMSKLSFEASQGTFRLEIEGHYNSNETTTYRKVKIEPSVHESDSSDESQVQTAIFPVAHATNKRKKRK